MSDVVAAVLRHVQEGLRAVADPADAPAMQAYMKTDMPFLGVKRPKRVPVERGLRAFDLSDRATWEAAVLGLWALPHREEKYVAIELAKQRRAHVTLASQPLFERLIREGQWWDLVDDVAVHLVGRVWLAHPDVAGPLMDAWIEDSDLWIRRTALIGQNRHRDHTDADRLFRYALARAPEQDFFIRKAIGWALRAYGSTDPDAVRRFVEAHRAELSGLSVREALKHL